MTEIGSPPLTWVDSFIDEIRPYLFLRETDNLLILLPNQSFRLNAMGFRILKPLLQGKKLEDLFPLPEITARVRDDLYNFFTGLGAMVKGCLGEGRDRPEVETIAYEPPFHKLPILSEIAVTYQCNLKCRFCYAGCPGTPKSAKEMSLDEIRTVLRKIRCEAEVPSVSITGGEPTLRLDLPEIIQAAHSEGLRVNLISNGTIIASELAGKMKSAGLASAQISLEGPNKQVHDELTGVLGSFERTLKCLSVLEEAGITVHTNTTISRGNIEEVKNMPRFLKELGMTRFSMNMIIPSALIKEFHPELLISYQEIGQVVIDLREIARNEEIKFLWYSPTPYCLFNPIANNLGNKGCAACDGLLSINPEGEVLPCSSFFEPQGSILSQPFSDLWNARSAVKIRAKDRSPKQCRTCDHFTLCEGACPLYWDIMGCGELPNHSLSKDDFSLKGGNSDGNI